MGTGYFFRDRNLCHRKKVAFYEGRFVKGNSVDIVLLR